MAVSAERSEDVDFEDRDGGPFSEINVTPLVDVMLVLLVVFMVAAPLMVQGVKIELPRTSGMALGRPMKPLIVSLARDGSVFVRDEKVAISDLPAHLQAIHSNEGDLLVYVRGDQAMTYGTMMAVIGRLAESGFSQVSLLSQPPAGGAR